MKVIHFNVKWLGCCVLVLCLLVSVFFNVIGYIFDWKYISVFAAAAQVDKFEVRSELLMEAMNQVGVCEPKDAAGVWADGLRKRSAALQFSVMSAELKAEYARQLETSAPNWVTGMSSPWVDSFRILEMKSPSENTRIIKLEFSTATSTGPAGNYNATLYISREGKFWRITKITMDKGLYPYTGFIM